MNNVISLETHRRRSQRQTQQGEANHDESSIEHGGGSGGPIEIRISILVDNEEPEALVENPQPVVHKRGARYAGVWIGMLIGLVIGFW